MTISETVYTGTCTYSPDDNKLRFYPFARLDAELYTRVKANGFGWAPKQKLFVAPMWTPGRADLMLELCGEIGDEDTSLIARAEDRAERFEVYREKRAQDADRAHAAVASIADNIPLGQPILIGHHSERHARKDAERIEHGMRKAIRMWETSQYWKSRAAGAIANAKYKELPGVRHRRIKGLESDQRKHTKTVDEAKHWIKAWSRIGLPFVSKERDADGGFVDPEPRPADDAIKLRRAMAIANYSHVSVLVAGTTDYTSIWGELDKGRMTWHDAMIRSLKVHGRQIRAAKRWLQHLEFRLEYERAMLAEAGGMVTDRTPYVIEKGGRVLVKDEWLMVLRVNRANGQINSVRTQQPSRQTAWSSLIPIERIKDYQPPTTEDIKTATKTTKLAPLVNYNEDGFISMTTEEFKRRVRSQVAAIRPIKPTGEYGWHRQRQSMKPNYGGMANVFITDAKVVTRPALPDSPFVVIEHVFNTTEDEMMKAETERLKASNARRAESRADGEKFDKLKDAVKAGVTVVSAPQLFPTPMPLAHRMVEKADLQAGLCVLEPSGGTGNLIQAALDTVDTEVLSYEINAALCSALARKFPSYKLKAVCQDFLQVTDHMGCYPRILMNPPFERGSDIKHVAHALQFLAPSGVLVAIMAGGPRQRAWFDALETASGYQAEWEDLPAGSFADQGTNVNTAMVTIRKAA